VSEDMILMLLRIAVIVFPAGFACFIVGFLYGRGSAAKAMRVYEEPMEWQNPEPMVRVTRLTSRHNTLEI
jgi:hypothetical protein